MSQKIAVYPGSFDPVTNGHLDILSRALRIFDRIIVAVTTSAHKHPLFTVDERVEMLGRAVKPLKGASVERFDGLLVNYAKKKNAVAMIRGLRVVSDFEYEFQMALMNRHLSKKYHGAGSLEAVYLMPDEKFTYLSSTLVKEVARLGGGVESFVPDFVRLKLKEKFDMSRRDS